MNEEEIRNLIVQNISRDYDIWGTSGILGCKFGDFSGLGQANKFVDKVIASTGLNADQRFRSKILSMVVEEVNKYNTK